MEATADPRDPEYNALGRLMTRARYLEGVGYYVARALGLLEPEQRNIGPALKAARKLARQEMPPWSRVSLDEVETWIEDVLTILYHRNRYAHWQRFDRIENGKWVPYHSSPRHQ